MLADLISSSRLVLAAAFVYFAHRPAIAVAILCLAGISDWLDGYVARKLGTTRFGAMMDPICDRTFVVTVLVTLVVVYDVPLWQMAVLVVRDVANTLGSAYVWLRNPTALRGLRPLLAGKVVTSLQFWSVVHVVLDLPFFGVTLAAVAAASLWALWDYSRLAAAALGATKSVNTP